MRIIFNKKAGNLIVVGELQLGGTKAEHDRDRLLVNRYKLLAAAGRVVRLNGRADMQYTAVFEGRTV